MARAKVKNRKPTELVEFDSGESYAALCDCGPSPHIQVLLDEESSIKDARRLIKWLEAYVAWAESK